MVGDLENFINNRPAGHPVGNNIVYKSTPKGK